MFDMKDEFKSRKQKILEEISFESKYYNIYDPSFSSMDESSMSLSPKFETTTYLLSKILKS
jgi:hypothetical protein